MQQSHSSETVAQDFGRPSCPQCSAAMWLMRIDPETRGHDRRMFTCPVCDYSESVVVKYA